MKTGLLTLVLGLAPTAAWSFAVTYTSLPYRSKADSPFYPSILSGETFVEDFEDQILDDRLTMNTGRISTTGRHSVDADDGVLDNLGVGFHWLVSGATLPGEPNSVRKFFLRATKMDNFPSGRGLLCWALLGLISERNDYSRHLTPKAY